MQKRRVTKKTRCKKKNGGTTTPRNTSKRKRLKTGFRLNNYLTEKTNHRYFSNQDELIDALIKCKLCEVLDRDDSGSDYYSDSDSEDEHGGDSSDSDIDVSSNYTADGKFRGVSVRHKGKKIKVEDYLADWKCDEDELKLNRYLCRCLGKKKIIRRDLVKCMCNSKLCKKISTFIITVKNMVGKDDEIIMDNELNRVGDLRREYERQTGIQSLYQEFYWLKHDTDSASSSSSTVPNNYRFVNSCHLQLVVDNTKPTKPNFIAVLLSVLKGSLSNEKYLEVQKGIDTVKQRDYNGSSADKARLIYNEIKHVVGKTKMTEAIRDTKSEIQRRKEQINQYERLLLHLIDEGACDADTITNEEQPICQSLRENLEYYRAHKNDDNDERIKEMTKLLKSTTNIKVRALLYENEQDE